MPLVSQRSDNLLNGVSQKAPIARDPSQAESQINGLSVFGRGVMKAPPTRHVAQLIATPGSTYDTPFMHPINRDASERYHVIVVNGDLKAFDAIDGTEYNVTFNNGKGYLTDSVGAGFRAVTIGDTTVIANRGVTINRAAGRTADVANGALVYVREADYSTLYSITLNEVTITYRTPDAGAASAREAISTESVAATLMNVLQAEQLLKTFHFVQYGSTLHIYRNDTAPYTLKVEDGLADHGLKMVKGSVQTFNDLPLKAPDGFLVEIIGDPASQFDNYWVEFASASVDGSQGVWLESPAPGTLTKMDPATLPHRLVRKGTLVTNRINTAFGGQPAVTNGPVTSSTADDWFYPNGSAVGALDAILSSNNDYVYRQPSGLDGTYRLFIVPVTIDTSAMYQSRGINLSLEYRNTVSDPWVAAPLADLTLLDLPVGVITDGTLSTELSLPAGAQIRVLLKYTDGLAPSKNRTAYVTVRNSLVKGGGARTKKLYQTDITFAPAAVYLSSCAITATVLRASGASAAFTFTCSGNKTGAQVATGLQALIAADGEFAGTTNPSSGVVRVSRTDGLQPDVAVTIDLSTSTTFYDPTMNLAVGGFIGAILTNLTDGSVGTITANTAVSITVGSLTGGTKNTFTIGDLIKVNKANKYFVFEEIPWNQRTVGDDATNPFPSFVDHTINEVFFTQARLGFTSGENVVLSRANDEFNFFRMTVSDLLDDEVIDVRAAHQQVALFTGVGYWEGNLVLNTDEAQYQLAGDPILTPKTVRIELMGRYPSSGVKPITLGNRMFFTHVTSGHTLLYDYARHEIGQPPSAVNVCDDIPAYITGKPVFLTGDAQREVVALIADGDQSKLYIYQYHLNGYKRDQLAWHYWQFSPGSRVVGVDLIQGTMAVIIKRTDGLYLENIDFDLVTPERGAFVDRRLSPNSLGVTTVFSGGNTTFTLPYSVATNGSEGTLEVVNRSTGLVVAGATRPSATQIRVPGDYTGASSAYIGVQYTFTYQLSSFWLRTQYAKESMGRTQVRYLDLWYDQATDFTVVVTPEGRSSISYPFTAATPVSGRFRIPIQSRSNTVVITVTSSAPGPVTLVAWEWEGFFNSRRKQL